MRIYPMFLFFFCCSLVFGQELEEVRIYPILSGLRQPLGVTHAGDERLFIYEKPGQIQLWLPSTGAVATTPFLDIQDRVLSSGGEQGLLGLAFHPQYSSNGFFFVNYTDKSGASTIARFKRDSTDNNRADPTSEHILLRIEQPFGNHNGGDIAFGPDGYLYISSGDGGSGGDPGNRAQNRQSLLGKLLRIDVNEGESYSIPASNPFAATDETLDEIWALGLRNPWRFSFDRQTGNLWIADVGQNAREEINRQPANSPGGENYGWRCYEGKLPFNEGNNCPDTSQLSFPVFDYAHEGNACSGSVTGGYVYRGNAFPAFQGHYFYADYCKGYIGRLVPDGNGGYEQHTESGIEARPFEFVGFGEDAEGGLYLVGISGTLYEIGPPNVSIREDIQIADAFSLSANPVSNILEVSSKGGSFDWQLFTVNGQLMQQGSSRTSIARLEMTHLPSGLFFLRIRQGQKTAVKKVVKN